MATGDSAANAAAVEQPKHQGLTPQPRVRRGRGAAAQSAPEEDQGPPVRIRIIRGQYVGLGCPDKDDRLYESDQGFGYTHEHPARAHFEERKGEFDAETQTMTPTSDVFVDGEIIQLWPIPEWEGELEETKKMRAADKRHSFSRKEAERRAREMVKQKIAEHVS